MFIRFVNRKWEHVRMIHAALMKRRKTVNLIQLVWIEGREHERKIQAAWVRIGTYVRSVHLVWMENTNHAYVSSCINGDWGPYALDSPRMSGRWRTCACYACPMNGIWEICTCALHHTNVRYETCISVGIPHESRTENVYSHNGVGRIMTPRHVQFTNCSPIV